MAFVLANFGKTSVTAAKAPLMWTYDAGADALATYGGSNYFRGAYPSLGAGHLIYVKSNTDFAILRVLTSSATGVTTSVVLQQNGNIVTNGLISIHHVSGASQDHTITTPGTLNTDTAFVQLNTSGTGTNYIVWVRASVNEIDFHTSEAVNDFWVNYLVIR